MNPDAKPFVFRADAATWAPPAKEIVATNEINEEPSEGKFFNFTNDFYISARIKNIYMYFLY